MKKAARLLLLIFVAFYGIAFAEKDTSYYTLSGGYSGLGWNVGFHLDKMIPSPFGKESNLIYLIPSVGVGLVEKGIVAGLVDYQFGIMQLYNNPKFIVVSGINSKISIEGIEIVPYIGLNYNNWVSTLGYSICYGEDCSLSFAVSTGYILKSIIDTPEAKKDSIEKPVAAESSSSRYFRPGIELSYPVYRSKMDFFDNTFPYMAGSAGLFFRIGPESFYLTTGAYAKLDVLQKEMTKDLGIFGINIVTLPLMDITWNRLFVEVPLLLSFGSGQIRFTGGALFDFYALSDFSIDVLGNQVLNVNDASEIEERFNEIPIGNMYWVLGLDLDVVRHWGIGVKFLIWNNAFDEPRFEAAFEPSYYQTRVSTYFVF
jgi:hypothetical protein